MNQYSLSKVPASISFTNINTANSSTIWAANFFKKWVLNLINLFYGIAARYLSNSQVVIG